MKHSLLLLFFSLHLLAAEPEFPLTADSKPQADVAKGTLIKDSYTAPESSVFPGTVREYQIYLPAGFDKTQPAHFMVFQDGVIYQAPVVFDNLIAKKDIPSLVGIFIKPGVVPAANDNALPRFNRSYEYDSITPTYSKFLIEEFLPAIEKKHAISLSQDPNHAAISGNSSGGICAFMVAWHRPDRFRRVFTGVGTYVGIHGADQLPVLVRKIEPKPLRIYLQSGTGDNNLYCGDWWMANQMMERSLTWAGYDVNHAWGEGGHNQKHASQIFPDVLRWLWRDWQTDIEVKANPKGESKWKGYEVVGDDWISIPRPDGAVHNLTASSNGEIWGVLQTKGGREVWRISPTPFTRHLSSDSWQSSDPLSGYVPAYSAFDREGNLVVVDGISLVTTRSSEIVRSQPQDGGLIRDIVLAWDGRFVCSSELNDPPLVGTWLPSTRQMTVIPNTTSTVGKHGYPQDLCLSPDQTQLYITNRPSTHIVACTFTKDAKIKHYQNFAELDVAFETLQVGGLCVDTEGRLYVATSLGIQVCDQAGRVNFIIPTPKPAHDVCFGGKDLSELFIACGDTIYKRPTKVHGVVSGQQAPIKPAPPKL
ncbi:MAG TPA: gluconolactonase [Verrucomicrobiales bacterium]|nr:gluconolactonase [Verrucomicrobiales bacterium]